MALRIAEPTPLRTVGFGATAGGTLVTIMAGFQGPAALVGLAALSVGSRCSTPWTLAGWGGDS